jgi:hypothetical protein
MIPGHDYPLSPEDEAKRIEACREDAARAAALMRDPRISDWPVDTSIGCRGYRWIVERGD